MADLPEISVVFPCLNEETTIGLCLESARQVLTDAGIRAEFVVADNGSTDRSPEIARQHGARVVPVTYKGYGNALREGLRAAQAKWLVFLDADMSYDCSDIPALVEALRNGADFAIGSRFRGAIDPGAMPALHRVLGTPVMTRFANLFFGCGITDINCGLRGLTRDAFDRLDLRSEGMEFASEMVIKAARLGLRIHEVPIKFHMDQRGREPHLRSFRDGWRHVQLMMHFCNVWVFFIPGLLLIAAGLGAILALPSPPAGLLTFLAAETAAISGTLILLLGLTAQGRVRSSKFYLADSGLMRVFARWVQVEKGLFFGLLAVAAGMVMILVAYTRELDITTEYGVALIRWDAWPVRLVMLGGTTIMCGLLVFFTCVYIGLFGIRVEEDFRARDIL